MSGETAILLDVEQNLLKMSGENHHDAGVVLDTDNSGASSSPSATVTNCNEVGAVETGIATPTTTTNNSTLVDDHSQQEQQQTQPPTTLYGVNLETLGAVEMEEEEEEDDAPSQHSSTNTNTTNHTNGHSNTTTTTTPNKQNTHATSSSSTTPSKTHTSSFASKLFGRFRGNHNEKHNEKHNDETNSTHQTEPETKLDADEKRYKETPMIFNFPTKKSTGSSERGLSTVASSSHISKTGKQPSQQQLFVETNLEDYLFSFQGIFTDRTMFRAFFRYLESEHNTEPLEFITRVNELEFTYYKMMKMVKDIQLANANLALEGASTSSLSSTGSASSATFSHFKTPFSDLPKMMLMMTQADKTKSPSKSESEPTTPRKSAKKQLSFFGLGKKSEKTPVNPEKPPHEEKDNHEVDDESSEKSSRFSLRLSILKKKNQKQDQNLATPQSNPPSNSNTPISNPSSPTTVDGKQTTLMELVLKDVPAVATDENSTTGSTHKPAGVQQFEESETKISLTTPTPRTMPKLNLDLVPKDEKTSSDEGGDDSTTPVNVEDNPNGMNRLLTVLKEKKKDELKNGVTSPEDEASERSDASGSSRTSGDRPRSLQHSFLTLPPNTPRSKYDQVLKVYRKQIMLAIQIMKDFIEEDSKKEINISSRDKRTFVGLFQESKQYQNFDEWMLPQPPHLLFRTMKNSVMYELENDSFPRFVRSDLWFKKLQNKGLSYLTRVGRLKEATYYPYGDDDFKQPHVFDRDIEFMEYLARDDYQWKLLGSKKEGAINVYKLSEKILFPNVGFYQKMQINKWTGILPFPFDAVKKCCMPGLQVHKYDPNITSCEELSFYDFETLKKMYPNEKFKRGPRSCGIIRYGVGFPFPFKTKRSFLSVCTAYYDKNEEKLTLLYKPCEHERFYMNGKGVNEGKKLIDIRDFQYYSIKKLDSYRTNITQIHLLDVGGNARFAINLLRMDRAKGMMKGFNDYIRKNINSIPEPTGDPVWKHVVSCMGKEAADRLDMSATLYNDLKMGRNIRNKSLAATIKKHRRDKKRKDKKIKKQMEKQQQLGTDVPTSPLSSTISSCSDDTSKILSRQNSTTSFGQSFISPEAILEEEEAMLTVFDADMENFTMTGTTDNDASDEEFDDEDEEDDGEL